MQREQIKFYFDNSSFEEQYISSRLYHFLLMMNDDDMPWSDNYVIPFDITVEKIDFAKYGKTLDSSMRHVFVLPWMKEWLENDSSRAAIEKINNMDSHYDNVVILADYSHESHLPGPIGSPVLSSRPWIECERYICAIHSMGHSNISGRSCVFKDIVSTWNYTSTVIGNMLKSHGAVGHFDSGILTNKQTEIDFLIPNRLGRRHRRELMYYLDEMNLLDNAEWSMVYPLADQLPNQPKYDSYTDKFGNNPRTMSRPWHVWSGMKPGEPPNQLLPLDLVEQSKVYIAVDTWVDYTDWGTTKLNTPADPTQPFYLYDISEKIVKAFLYAMPGFLFARPGSVNRLRELGFWMPGGDYNDSGYARDLIKQLADAMQSYDLEQKDIVEHLINNRDLIKSKKLHFDMSRDMFELISKTAKLP